MLDRESLIKINGKVAVDALDVRRADEARLTGATQTEKIGILGEIASKHGGTVPVDEARVAEQQARFNTSQQQAIVVPEGALPEDTVTPGASVFAPEGSVPSGAVTVNPNAAPVQPEVTVNPPQPQ